MRKRILEKKGLSGVMEFALCAVFVLGAALTVSLPFTLRSMLHVLGVRAVNDTFYWRAFAFLLIFGILMLIFVYFAARIFHTINQKDPFVDQNVRSLSAMSAVSLLLGVDCLGYAVVDTSIFTIILGLVFLFLWGLFLVLRELFRAAVLFKRENDFTV